MDPDATNCVILRIHVDFKTILAMPSNGKIVYVYGSKKTPI